MARNNLGRQHALDNLRTFLTCLVILHHTAIPYGGSGSWNFTSHVFPKACLPLGLLNAINQSFFMGLFFWISGRLTAMSLQTNTPSKFLRGRAVRLGLPTLIYTCFVQPITLTLALTSWELSAIETCFVDYWRTLRDVHGPVWYTATLLLFDTIFTIFHYAGLRSTRWMSMEHREYLLTLFAIQYRLLGAFGLLGVAIISFVLRNWYPVGVESRIVSVQSAYLPQYVFAYVLGQLSWSLDVFIEGEQTDESELTNAGICDQPQIDRCQPVSRLNPLVAVLLSTLAFNLVFVPEFLYGTSDWLSKTISQTPGGWNCPALLYALWNEFSFGLIGSSMVHYFRNSHGEQATSWLWRSRYSYAAFLVHAPVSVAIEVAAETLLSWGMENREILEKAVRLSIAPVVMTTLIASANISASFVLGRWILVTFPITQKVV